MVESDENKISNTHTLVAKGKKENPEGPRRRAESIPPTAEEVKEYATSKGYPNYAAPFLDHYEMVGWVYGKSKHKIKDWKAAYRRWVSTEKTGIGQAAPVITSNRKLADFR